MEIQTPRLLLRELRSDDWPAVLAYQSDPRYLRHYAWEGRSAEDVQAFLEELVSWQHEEPRHRYQLAVTLRETGELIGNCGLRLDQPDATQGDIGYELTPAQWGHGYATEAAHAMLAFGFGELRLHRIWSWCLADNQASVQVLERLGMRLEGHQRQVHWVKGSWRDVLLYGLLVDEWQTQQAHYQANRRTRP